MTDRKTIVGVFENRAQAQKAVNELRQAGFQDEHIGVTGRDTSGATSTTTGSGGDADEGDTYASEGGMAGLAAGAGVGGLWGLGILAGVLPVVGPAIAAGSLAVILSSAAAGAAAAGLAGSLIGLGVSKEEAEYYESEVGSGRILVTVNANGRGAEATAILRRCGGYDMTNRQSNLASGSAYATSTGSTATGSLDEQTRRDRTTGRHGQDEQTIQAREEQLRVEKDRVQTGEAKIRKEVHTEHKSIDVPVQREEIVIERHPASHQSTAAGSIKEGEEIRIPVSEEQVTVDKQTVAKEEVSIGKRKVQGTQHVDETLRKEDIKIDTEGDVDVRDRRRT